MEVGLETESKETTSWGMMSLRGVSSKKIRTYKDNSNSNSVGGAEAGPTEVIDHRRCRHQTEEEEKQEGGYTYQERCSTPTSEESRIPSKLSCPPAPRKRKSAATSSSKCRTTCTYDNGAVAVQPRQFFTPPDLETVFIRRHVN